MSIPFGCRQASRGAIGDAGLGGTLEGWRSDMAHGAAGFGNSFGFSLPDVVRGLTGRTVAAGDGGRPEFEAK